MKRDGGQGRYDSVQILGTGYARPDRVLFNADLVKMVNTTDEWIVTRTGICQRRIVGKDVATSDIALEASRAALARSGMDPEDLELIIVGTVTPDMLTPSTACFLQERLGARNAAAFDLSAGCTGFIYSMVVAQNFLLAGSTRNALVVGAETLSKVTDWTDRNTCVIFADGAGAMVLGKGSGPRGILSSYLGADGTGSSLITIPGGGSRIPASSDSIAEHQHFIKMQGQEVFKFAVKAVPECALRVLKEAALSIDDVDHVVFHQANIRIIESAAKRLKVPMEKVLSNIQETGNTSAASIPLLIAQEEEAGTIKPGEIVLMVGFGAGLTTGAVLVRWGHSE
ncbi:MAG: beta-ketoacyl-ACP synthase III [Syntrophomonas sp.]